MKTKKEITGELSLIENIRSEWRPRTKSTSVALGIGDDCAILRPPSGHEVLVTTDFTLEGRHFRRDWHPAESVGHRALARGLSDLAAMGARPFAVFLSLALPGEMLANRAGRIWVERFFAGLRALAEEFNVQLAGGDTSESPCGLVLVDIVLVGAAPVGRSLRRSGGRPGDLLYVTGALGGSAAELQRLQMTVGAGKRISVRAAGDEGKHPQLFPQPRVAVGLELLRRRIASAAIDVSDGLSTDVMHLAQESGVGAEIDAAAIPVHALARKNASTDEQALELALHGGEDYEILFAASPKVKVPARLAGLPVSRIGRLVRGAGVWLVEGDGERKLLKARGWEHFGG